MIDEKPYFVTNTFFRKMRYLVNGRHKWRRENPISFEQVMDEVWSKVSSGATPTDFLPADDYIIIQQEREGLSESRYPLGSENPLFEVRIGGGMRAIFMLLSHCKEEFLCCKLCKKELTFYDIGIYGD